MQGLADFIGGLIKAPFVLIAWIIIGFLAGAIARRIMGSKNTGCASDFLLGFVGAIVGGFVVGWLGFSQSLDIGLGIGTLITAVIGAVVLIALGRILRPARR
jgi:uncharacterized membrane protein YeaQ/YmgE (transglycosylase-associated protein family)